MQEAIREKKYHYLADPQGRPAGLLGTRPLQAVTFIDNHDTGSTQAHWRFPRLAKLEGYAYILTHPGMPSVFWEHFFEVRNNAKELKMIIIFLYLLSVPACMIDERPCIFRLVLQGL